MDVLPVILLEGGLLQNKCGSHVLKERNSAVKGKQHFEKRIPVNIQKALLSLSV